MRKTVGILTIGQCPRPDLLEPYQDQLIGLEIIERGALDRLDAGDLPPLVDAEYPLVTRMRDGTPVTVAEAFLAPLLQQAIVDLENDGVVAIVLLCAGPFEMLYSRLPLFIPFQVARTVLRAMGMRHIGVVCPVDAQQPPAQKKWQAAGFAPLTWTISPDATPAQIEIQLAGKAAGMPQLECIVFDYVGYANEQVASAQAATPIPLLDLGQMTMMALNSTLAPQ